MRVSALGLFCYSCHRDFMDFSIRQKFLFFLFIVSLLVIIPIVPAWISFLQGEFLHQGNMINSTKIWWQSWRLFIPNDSFWALLGLSFLSFFPLIVERILHYHFKKSSSPEIFFLRIFLLLLPLQNVRLLLPLIPMGLLNENWAIPVMQVSWFIHLISVITLFNINIFSRNFFFRRFEVIIGIEFLAALGLVVKLPFDITQPLGNLLYRSGSESVLSLVFLSLEILTVLSLVATAFTQDNFRYLLLALATLLIVGGVDLMFFISYPLLFFGTFALIVGVGLFAHEIRFIYQWR